MAPLPRPRSRDLASELPALAAALDEPWGRIPRITCITCITPRVSVNANRRPVVPRSVPEAGRMPHTGRAPAPTRRFSAPYEGNTPA